MSVFYDEASLVLVPSGYKASKVYAQKPLTADGQLTFSRASTATRVNASGLIETVASNVPRLDYLGSTCPKLQLEPSRTNLKTYSEDGTGGQWGNPYQLSVTANQAASPDGATTADQIADTSASTPHRFEPNFTATNGTDYTFSYFAKANTLTQCHIYGFTDNFVFSGQQVIFNLSTGTVVSNTGGGTAAITPYGSGWYRVSLTLTSGASSLGYWGFGPAKNGEISYTGDGSSFYMWGIQLEAGAYATSYIPTTTAAVTRLAESASKTGIASLIGQSEGTVFVEFKRVPKGVNYQAVVTLQGASTAYLIEMYFGTANTLLAAVYNSGAQFQAATSALSEGTYKAAIAYKTNDFAFYVNGVQISTDNSGTVPALSTYNLGDFTYAAGNAQADGINQALLFKTRLTNAQLAEITQL